MPSIDDLDGLDAAHHDRELTVSLPSDDVLSAVKAEGGRRRARRHRRNSVIAGFAVAIVALPAIVLLPGGEPDTDEVTAVADEDSTTTSDVTVRESTTVTSVVATETTVVVPVGDPVTTPTTVRRTATTVPRTATTVPVTTAPPLVCQNSTDERCGEFRWDPAPGANRELNAAFAAPTSSTTAVVGQEVEFIVDWSDDADLAWDSFAVEPGTGAVVARPCQYQQRYGPWTPPAAAARAGSLTYHYTFTSPGEYRVSVYLATGVDCVDPYLSQATIAMTITVAEAPAA